MAVSISVGSRKRGRESNVHYNGHRSEMFKIVFLGDSNVGKTCLAKLFADRRTLEQSTATIGFDYHTMDIRLEDGTNATLQIWDTAGMEKFRNAPALVPQYYHNTDGIVLVFDITERGSFDGLDNWVSEMKKYCTHRSRTEKVNMILVGNKLDLKDQRKVTRKAAQAYADRHNMAAYIELSAKDINYLQLLEDSFNTLAKQMVKSRQEAEVKSIARATVARRTDHECTPILEDFASSGSFANDWVILSSPDEQVPDYVVSAQEKRRSEPNRCSC